MGRGHYIMTAESLAVGKARIALLRPTANCMEGTTQSRILSRNDFNFCSRSILLAVVAGGGGAGWG